MHEQIIEPSEYLRNWWDRGLIVQPYAPEDNDSDDCQVEDESGIVGLPGSIRLHVIGTGRVLPALPPFPGLV